MITLNEISLIFFLACILVYVILMYINSRKINASRYYQINEIYRHWITSRIKDQNLIVVIQALRNIVMGNSIYASALLILLGILVGLYSGMSRSDTTFLFGIEELPISLVQISLNVFIILFCVLNFILAIRMMNRTTLLFCAFPEKDCIENNEALSLIQESFMSGQQNLLLGMRGLFFLVPALTWLIQPILFMAGSVAVIYYLVFIHDIRRAKELRDSNTDEKTDRGLL